MYQTIYQTITNQFTKQYIKQITKQCTKKLTKNNVNIKFKEGILKIKYDENENIFMTGPVSEIKKITFKI